MSSVGMHAAGNLLCYAREKKFPLSEGEDSNSGIPEEKRMIRIMIIISQAGNAVKAVLTEGTRRHIIMEQPATVAAGRTIRDG